MEKEYQVSWGKVIGILILIVVVIAIIFIVYPKKPSYEGATNTYINNINLMKEAGFEYFKGNNLPDKIGESNKITLEEMVNSNLLLDFKDESGNVCNKEESYIKVTKSLENEYNMKVFLSCKKNSDYIVTTIMGKECPECNQIINDNNNNQNNNSNSNQNTPDKNNNNNNYAYKPGNTTNVTYNINYVNNNCSGNNCVSNVYYTVTFKSNGGTEVAIQTIRSGGTATYEASTRVGYEFLGWYLDGEKYDFNTPVTKKITLIAKWKEKQNSKNEYDVCFVTNSGTKISCQTILEGDYAYKPSNPTKSCYNFAGWYTDNNYKYQYNFNNKVYNDITLYAKWIDNGTCKNKYTVSFNSNGGSSISAQRNILEGDTAYRPNNPTKACSRFVGWYTNSNLTNLYNFNDGVYRDITLYAKWENDGSCRELYQVRFDSNGGSSINYQNVYEGDRAYEPSSPWRNGYRFIGWYYNGSRFDFNRRIYQNYTLTAKWEKESEQYNTYCKINRERYFSTSYVNGSGNTWNYNWTIKFDKIKTSDLRITNIGYLNTTALYNESYYDEIRGKEISMVGSTSKYSVVYTSGSMLKTYSLKSNNFSKYLSSPYQRNGIWYTDATVNIHNYNNVTKYYAPNLKDYIYFVPFYFDVEYTDSYNCFNDLASNYYKYQNNYKVVNTFYK